MKIKGLAVAVLLAGVAVNAYALSPELIDWVNGPVQFIMTKEELATFRSLQSDTEARAFVDLFWARRDPTPDTPRNEAREQFEARVAWADKNLKDAGRHRGAMTDRGKTLILYGTPTRVRGTQNPTQRINPDLAGELQKDQRISDNWIEWEYEGDDVKTTFLVPKAKIRFVDRMGNDTFQVERGPVDLAAAQNRAVQRMILYPELKEVPTYAPAAEAEAPAPAAAPVVMTALPTPALAAAVAEFKAKAPAQNQASAAWGEYITSFGETFVPVGLYLPKSVGFAADQNVTFFGVVEDESGKPVVAFEETRKLSAAKDDLYADKSLTLPAGKHRAIVGVAQNGKTLLASTRLQVSGTLTKDATAVSPVILSNYIEPLTAAQAPTDPFAFGGVKVVPKADKTFRTSDDLWYFFELRNPGLAEPLPADQGSATGAPLEQLPKIQVKMDVTGTDAEGKPIKRSAPPREVDAVPMKGVPGHYGIGNAIPLASFKPGDYTFTLKVIDTVKKASYTLTDTFKVVQ